MRARRTYYQAHRVYIVGEQVSQNQYVAYFSIILK